MSIGPTPITIESLCYSETAIARGIDNSPPSSLLPNLRRLASGLDSIQVVLGSAIEISSGYRCPELNRIVGGTPGSQHQQGLAADFVCTGFGEPIQVAIAIVNSTVDYDQIILEFGRWVHVSFSPAPRRRALTIYSSANGYLDGIVAAEGHRLA
ncbi:MAG: D-Ala-D-Ala carboxypeptidase family metallohydrolase [Burkholderiales bacterium]